MAGSSSTHDFSLPYSQPSSPPATPGTHSHLHFHSISSHTSPIYKKMGLSVLAQSPPLEFLEAIGDGPQFYCTRPLATNISRPSTTLGDEKDIHIPQSDEEGASDEEGYDSERDSYSQQVGEESFILEELSDEDYGYNDIIEVVKPDCYEEACSERATEEKVDPNTGIINGFKQLNCAGDSSDDEQRRRYERKKKRWSAGLFKRTHSQSVGSDTDNEDTEALDAHDVGSSARRLRRRVRGPGDRNSLLFDEFPHINVAEVDEPEDGVSVKGPPSLCSDAEEFTLDALPFWDLEAMEMDSTSDDAESSV